MDGTIADLYGVSGWLSYLMNEDAFPYMTAKPLIKMNVLARILNKLQRQGYRIGIISWLSKNSNASYDAKVTFAKIAWLQKHLASVRFDEINIVAYGTPKERFLRTSGDILFDDEFQNRINWTGIAFDADNIIETLKGIC
jgi:hypothetical protein